MRYKAIAILLLAIVFIQCEKDDGQGVDLTDIPYAPEPYQVNLPDHFPSLESPGDNPLTKDGVQLGRHLFYDPILSADSTMSCGSCHFPEKAFTDGLAVSTGIDGIAGKRSSMSLVNSAFAGRRMFWDGRSDGLEAQALLPVEDPIELHHMWPDLEEQLRALPRYHELFRKAFGIEYSDEITKELAAKAIAQFERIILSTNSKLDKAHRRVTFLDPDEQDGFDMFFDTSSLLPDAECGHCHEFPTFGSVNDFFNNGLDSADADLDFPDKGRGEVTGRLFDNGKFKAPSLRNIELTAPYMHDGRFNTLEEVMDHYDSGGHFAPNLDVNIRALDLSSRQKKAIIAFLKTLTDTSYLQNPDVLSPY